MANEIENTQDQEIEQLTLSQAILSPLDSIFQAQIHAARSFLNMLLQIGYPHLVIDVDTGHPVTDEKVNPPENYKPYEIGFNFSQNNVDGKPQIYTASIPALALVPLNSLAISDAEFNFGLKVISVQDFEQIQDSERKSVEEKEGPGASSNRKWNLVKDPKSLKGIISSKPSDEMKKNSKEAFIDISIKLAKTPIPAALDNLLTSLTKSVVINENDKNTE